MFLSRAAAAHNPDNFFNIILLFFFFSLLAILSDSLPFFIPLLELAKKKVKFYSKKRWHLQPISELTELKIGGTKKRHISFSSFLHLC